jgi:hypothetical protein
MTTLRHRRALSMYRRSGAQGRIDGKTPRHAQGWRDQQQDDDFAAIEGVLYACGLAAAWFASIWAIV